MSSILGINEQIQLVFTCTENKEVQRVQQIIFFQYTYNMCVT